MKKNTDYTQIFNLIDKSNARNISLPVKEKAIKQLQKLGIYNQDGDIITKDMSIILYYTDNYC